MRSRLTATRRLLKANATTDWRVHCLAGESFLNMIDRRRDTEQDDGSGWNRR